jgi:lipoyl synthase
VTEMRASIGTLAVLGLRDIRMAAVPTTAYLMVGGRCCGDCSYCGQGRSAEGDHSHLSRVVWPEVSDEILEQAFVAHPGAFQRVCFQTTASQGVLRKLLALVPRIRDASGAQVSVSYRVTSADEADRLFAAGVQRIGVAIDCCSERLYPQRRGGSLADAVSLVKDLAGRYPGRISTHLIIGLGEDEMEAAELMIALHRAGVLVSLFAFTPIRGTRMGEDAPPPLMSYRRLQLLLGLLDLQEEGFYVAYDAHRTIHSLGLSEAQLRAFLEKHFVFVTHGCPGCNRPFYTEAPGGTMYNFPSVPVESATREIDSFMEGLIADDFDFSDVKSTGAKGTPIGVMNHYLSVEKSLGEKS